MPPTVISSENLSKSYRLGVIGTGTFYGDVKRWWTRRRGLPDPYLKIGEHDHGNRAGEIIWALKDVNFIIQQGEAVGIIGRNGAGKSTLLKILSQVTAPTTGFVKIKGRMASLLEVGTGFHAELTGRENVYLNGAIMGMTRADVQRKFDEIVAFSGVEKFIDTPVKRYSSGMYVRLAFAVAAHLEPEILVVDEVLAVGDVEFQKKCLGKMGDVASEGRTILFVSHNMGAISRLCSRAITLQFGRVVNDGPAQETIESYYESLCDVDIAGTGGERSVDSDMGFVGWSIGQPVGSVNRYTQYPQQSCDLYFVLEVKVPIQQAYFGITIYSQDGQLIWSMRSKDREQSHVDLMPGKHEIAFKLPSLPLKQGQYRLVVSANTEIKQHDLWEVVPNLEVLPWNETGLPFKWQGILNLPGEFYLREISKGVER